MVRDAVVRAACEGDSDARRELVSWLYADLGPFLVRRVPPQQLDDVLHDTMGALLVKMPTHAPREARLFSSWARGFAVIEARAAWRQTRRERRLMLLLKGLGTAPRTSLSARVARRELLEQLGQNLGQLPAIYREALLDRLGERDDEALAARDHVTAETVRWRRAHGRKLLRGMWLDSQPELS